MGHWAHKSRLYLYVIGWIVTQAFHSFYKIYKVLEIWRERQLVYVELSYKIKLKKHAVCYLFLLM